MGALIHYSRNVFKPGVYEVRQTVAGIPAGDAVRATFPELADTALTMQRNGRALYDGDLIEDGDTIWIAPRPEWVAAAAGAGFWSQVGAALVNAFIYAAVSYLVSYLLKPKGKKDKQASPAYSVAIDQNAARLGGTIPVQYGRCHAMPDIASQPYAEYVAHNERVSMILCLGMGEYQINDIFLGESRVLDFPPGNVTTWIFKPSDHAQAFGNIERITGVCEDMLTIPESMGVDLAAPNDPPEVAVAATASGGVLSPNNPAQGMLWNGLVPGRRYVVTNSLGASVVVGYVGQGANNSAVFDGPLPAAPPEQNVAVSASLVAFDDAIEGRAMALTAQQSFIGQVRIDEIIYVRDDTAGGFFGPFQVARIEQRGTMLVLRINGLGFASETGERGFTPQRWLWVVRNRYVTFYITEDVAGVDPDEPYRWRGWYAASRPGVLTDTVFVDIAMPNGIAWVTDDGGYKSITVTFYIDIQEIDANGTPIGGVWRNVATISGATSNQRRVTFKYVSPWGAARYRVRVARINTRDQRASKEISAASLSSIRSRIWHPLGTPMYENCTLLVMQFTASAGLNAASNRRVTVDCTRKVPWQGYAEPAVSTNPADAFADAYINADYGGGRPANEVDQDKIYRLRGQWDQTNGFNGIFDSETTLIEAMQAIMAPVKAAPLPVGKIISVAQDCPRPRAYAFGDDTIVRDSLTVAYLFDGENQPDCLCILYRDPQTWAESRAYYPFEGVRPETIDLFGCTSRDHALAWAKLTWQQRQFNRKRATFDLEGEGYLLDPLDRFGVTIPAVAHGQAGRVIQYDMATHELLCDCYVPEDTTQISFFFPDGTLGTPYPCTRVSDRIVRVVLNSAPNNAIPSADARNFVLLHDASQYFEFNVTDLRTSQELRVSVTGAQYDARAYAGTFVENWITGD